MQLALVLVGTALDCLPANRLIECRWQAKLPEEVQAAGKCGAPCPQFWPQSPDYQPPPLGAPCSVMWHCALVSVALGGTMSAANLNLFST